MHHKCTNFDASLRQFDAFCAPKFFDALLSDQKSSKNDDESTKGGPKNRPLFDRPKGVRKPRSLPFDATYPTSETTETDPASRDGWPPPWDQSVKMTILSFWINLSFWQICPIDKIVDKTFVSLIPESLARGQGVNLTDLSKIDKFVKFDKVNVDFVVNLSWRDKFVDNTLAARVCRHQPCKTRRHGYRKGLSTTKSQFLKKIETIRRSRCPRQSFRRRPRDGRFCRPFL